MEIDVVLLLAMQSEAERRLSGCNQHRNGNCGTRRRWLAEEERREEKSRSHLSRNHRGKIGQLGVGKSAREWRPRINHQNIESNYQFRC